MMNVLTFTLLTIAILFPCKSQNLYGNQQGYGNYFGSSRNLGQQSYPQYGQYSFGQTYQPFMSNPNGYNSASYPNSYQTKFQSPSLGNTFNLNQNLSFIEAGRPTATPNKRKSILSRISGSIPFVGKSKPSMNTNYGSRNFESSASLGTQLVGNSKLKNNHIRCVINFGVVRLREPLLMYNDFTIMIPNGAHGHNVLNITDGSTFKADCGFGNVFTGTEQQQYRFTCRNGLFYYGPNANDYYGTISNLGCQSVTNTYGPVAVRDTRIRCGESATKYEIGVKVSENNDQRFLHILDSCIHNIHKSVLYVKGHIWGFVNRTGSSARHSIFLGNWDDGTQISSNFFNSNNIQASYRNGGFHRGHFSPYEDYKFDLLRKATNLYFNMSPMSVNFNSGKWSSLEAHARDEIKRMNASAITYTGGLNLFRTRFLDGRSIKVPELFFKIVKVNRRGIALFLFTDEVTPGQIIQLKNSCRFTAVTKRTTTFYFSTVDNFFSCFNTKKEFSSIQELKNLGFLDQLQFRPTIATAV